MKFTKKAAMFGLDARIALAIFGALSVISGAALYSAIKQSKVTAFITHAQEFGKAWEQYYLDTGVDLPPHDTHQRQTCALIKNIANLDDWKGPYIGGYDSCLSTDRYIKHPEYNEINLMTLRYTEPWPTSKYCSSTTHTCGLWLYMDQVTANIADEIDERIDNSDGLDKGNFRAYSNTYWMYLLPLRNPN